jgi:hypothetical protein
MAEYTYQVGSVNGGVDVTRLLAEITAAGYQVTSAALSEDLADVTILSEATEAQIDAVVNAHQGPDSLDCYKAEKFAKIDAKTSELIASGFQFAGKVFSLSVNAQMKMMGINQIRSEPEVEYPIHWNTKDDMDYYDVSNANEMRAFYLTGVGTYRAHVDIGSSLKDQVRIATSKTEVDAIVDPR